MVKRRVWNHHRGSQNLYIEDEQTAQWSKKEFEDTKGAVRIIISKRNTQHNDQKKRLKTPKGSQNLYIEDEQTTQWSKEEFEDTTGVVRIRISKTNRQHNGQKKSLKTPQG